MVATYWQKDNIFELSKNYKVTAFDNSYIDIESSLIHDDAFALINNKKPLVGLL